ncbi:MAG: P1 family peptidase [Anaerolineae bacterium]
MIGGSLTDVGGLLVGHWTDRDAATGCTVVLCEQPHPASVDVRGGAPGTRETDLLAPGRLVERVDAIVLAGGSAFGLGAAQGAMQWLYEHGRGFPTGVIPVPIVPAAIIFDLWLGRPAWPDAEAGYAATAAAATLFEAGSVGAGTGATIGKFAGPGAAMKSGLGTASLCLPDGLVVAALIVVNALGNVVDPSNGAVVAGARSADGFVAFARMARPGQGDPLLANSTVGVVATNAAFGKTELQRVAQMAQAGMARAIRPVFTQHDGDTLFALSTGSQPADLSLVGALAADAVAAAIVQAVRAATSLAGLPALRDLPRATSG